MVKRLDPFFLEPSREVYYREKLKCKNISQSYYVQNKNVLYTLTISELVKVIKEFNFLTT